MKQYFLTVTLLVFLFSFGFAELNRSVQKGEILRRVSTDELNKKYDHQYKGSVYTFVNLGKDEVTVIVDAFGTHSAKNMTYVKTYDIGNEITLKRKGALRYTETIFINTESMEFHRVEAAYLLGKEFSCSISYGKLER